MAWKKIDKAERWRTFLSLLVYTLIYNLTQALRGYPFFIDDLLKRLFFDWLSFLLAYSFAFQLKSWLNKYYDWNENPKKGLLLSQ